MISFENTKIGFSYKTNRSLRRAYWLFSMLRYPWMVVFGRIFTPLALKLKLPIKGAVRNTIFKQFCGGENIDDCDKEILLLGEHGVGAILDYSAEGKEKESVFDQTTKQIQATIQKADGHPYIPFSVFKPTGVGRFKLMERVSRGFDLSEAEKEEYQRVKERVDKLCKTAYERNIRVFIDAEESWYQQAIDDLAREMMAKYNQEATIVWTTLQMYRWDRMDFLKEEHRLAKENGYYIGVKLVRGAYMEKERERALNNGYPDPIHKDKESTDRDYNAAMDYCTDHLDCISVCAGTHNEESCFYMVELMDQKNIMKDDSRIWFSQLLGMSDNISFNLGANGFNATKYVPYGPIEDALPYLIRRAQENSSASTQSHRELDLLDREIERRKRERREKKANRPVSIL